MFQFYRKLLYASVLFFFLCQTITPVFAQKLELIPSAGAQYSDANIATNWSIGEPVVKTIGNQTHFITQGFNQTEWIILSEWDYVPLNLSVGLYPNPISRELNIRFPGREDLSVNYHVLVYDMLYKPVFEAELPYEENQYDLSDLSNGTYILHITDETGNFLKTFKIVKNR